MTAMLDVVIAAVVVEAAALLGYRHVTGRGPAPASLLPNLAAGGMMAVAARAALGGAAWAWVSACLLGGLAAHLVDLWRRWNA